MAALSENALELMRWQPVQWQAMVSNGRFVTLRRTRPQRQPPSFSIASVFIPFPCGCQFTTRGLPGISSEKAGMSMSNSSPRLFLIVYRPTMMPEGVESGQPDVY